MHGPPGMFGPTWTFPIRVIDTIALSLRPKKRLRWRTARDSALSKWPVSFAVEEDDAADYPPLDTLARCSNAAYLSSVLVPGALRLMRYKPLGLSRGAWAWYEYSLKGGLCAFYMPAFWARFTEASRMYVIGHEVGHNLGLDHGGSGIMAGAYVPNAHDLESVRAYYA